MLPILLQKEHLKPAGVCVPQIKALVAQYGPELMEIAKEKKINFLFEASCGGGIPIIRAINGSLNRR